MTVVKMATSQEPVSLAAVPAESLKKKSCKRLEHGDYGSSSFNLRNLSKLILPPLGVSGNAQTQAACRGKVISPMDSRYRSEFSCMQ